LGDPSKKDFNMLDGSTWLAIGLIFGALMAGILSPGPSFVMTARTALAKPRSEALSLSVGLGLGATVVSALCLAGLTALLKAVPLLYAVLKVVGGAYLAWMGWQMWREASKPLASVSGRDAIGKGRATKANRWAAFHLGLLTQWSNPKAAVVYGGVFAAFLPEHFPLLAAIIVCAGVFLLETTWMMVVALALSSAGPRAVYLRGKTGIDRFAGGVMGLLGVRLVMGAADV
jgi:threonine/homoserine/homoserine lactone efflux protein